MRKHEGGRMREDIRRMKRSRRTKEENMTKKNEGKR